MPLLTIPPGEKDALVTWEWDREETEEEAARRLDYWNGIPPPRPTALTFPPLEYSFKGGVRKTKDGRQNVVSVNFDEARGKSLAAEQAAAVKAAAEAERIRQRKLEAERDVPLEELMRIDFQLNGRDPATGEVLPNDFVFGILDLPFSDARGLNDARYDSKSKKKNCINNSSKEHAASQKETTQVIRKAVKNIFAFWPPQNQAWKKSLYTGMDDLFTHPKQNRPSKRVSDHEVERDQERQ